MGQVVVEGEPNAAEAAAETILAGLLDYNRGVLGNVGAELVTVSMRDDDGLVVGGAVGEVGLGWLFVKTLWLDGRLHGRGIGSLVLATLEDEARTRGATNSYVDTFSFQAPGFYEKQGYREFGRLDGFPTGHSRFWMTKAL